MRNKLKNQALYNSFFLFAMMMGFQLIPASAFAQDSNNRASTGATINNLKIGTIDKSKLIDAGKVSLTDSFSQNFKVSSFRLTKLTEGKDPMFLDNKSNGEFTAEMIDLLKSCQSGDKIYFEYIKCKGSDDTSLSLGSIAFTII